MSKEHIIIFLSWGIMSILLIIFVPRDRIRHAILIFFFKHVITWVVGLSIAEMKLLEYPVRPFFPYATKASFDFEFFIYPGLCILFNLNYPEGKSKLRQFMFYVYYCSGMTVIEVLMEKYTDLIEYSHWAWYATWISLFITFYLSHKFYIWFFKLNESHQV